LSANPHGLEQTIDVLVLVKAYPQPSTKYTESVCVAGLRVDTPVPEWVRLNPVQFRLLKRDRQFSKYDLIRVLVRRPTSGDTRPESFTPILDTIEKIDHLPSAPRMNGSSSSCGAGVMTCAGRHATPTSFAGTLAKRQNQFVLLGAFWPPKPTRSLRPKPQELALFD
jgi:hypothetical protein